MRKKAEQTLKDTKTDEISLYLLRIILVFTIAIVCNLTSTRNLFLKISNALTVKTGAKKEAVL
jgi:hypothetical protein